MPLVVNQIDISAYGTLQEAKWQPGAVDPILATLFTGSSGWELRLFKESSGSLVDLGVSKVVASTGVFRMEWSPVEPLLLVWNMNDDPHLLYSISETDITQIPSTKSNSFGAAVGDFRHHWNKDGTKIVLTQELGGSSPVTRFYVYNKVGDNFVLEPMYSGGPNYYQFSGNSTSDISWNYENNTIAFSTDVSPYIRTIQYSEIDDSWQIGPEPVDPPTSPAGRPAWSAKGDVLFYTGDYSYTFDGSTLTRFSIDSSVGLNNITRFKSSPSDTYILPPYTNLVEFIRKTTSTSYYRLSFINDYNASKGSWHPSDLLTVPGIAANSGNLALMSYFAPPEAKPNNVSVSVGETSVTLSWSPPTQGTPVEYYVRIVKGSRVVQHEWIDGSNTQYVFSGLEADTTYRVGIQARYAGEPSEFVKLSATTEPPPDPGQSNLSGLGRLPLEDQSLGRTSDDNYDEFRRLSGS